MENQTIPCVVHEDDMSRMERTNARQAKIIVLLIILFTLSNAFWIHGETQYEDVVATTQEVTQDNNNGVNNFVGGDGVISNGKASN